MSFAWAPGTREVYGSGLLIYHVFCDAKGIRESQRAPADSLLISSFVATLAGSYSGSTLSDYFYGVRAWHVLHSVPWSVEQVAVDALLKAATTLAPQSSKRKKRLPYTVEVLLIIRHHLDLTLPFDAAVWSCLTTIFYSVARVGEFTVRTVTSFDPTIHVTRSNMRRIGILLSPCSILLALDQIWGEDAFWSRQDGPTDPEAALNNHFAINNPLPNSAIFSYGYKNSSWSLTKSAFLKRLHSAFAVARIEPLQGHGIRIGATLEHLLRGVPFDVVKSMGRWASDAFTIYLRTHAMVPYMQANPTLEAVFFQRSMPPVR
ncbi:hypothetical protein C8R45DRAFT_815665 [Mycena sanguinolenta]|nr:hypothetical protein C8R45DRAFT_815665 [Mycena sanguinolenta]